MGRQSTKGPPKTGEPSTKNEEKPKSTNEPKNNQALGSKGKEKLVDDEDEEDDETEQLKQKAECEAQVTLERPIETDSFPNARFKVTRGATGQECEFTLAEQPCLNLYDWILLLNLLLRDEQKYEPFIAHLKRMLVLYIQVVGKMDIKIASLFR
ncbi:unnamed protein product [Lactuca saligna]|uniref:Uncharacterized protein n=1 Tax=Lactuca saligna TaxID=75948 RepID=A0AA35Y6L1_LACSI|nr:unnamed protein product [Lactuca saligna]